MKGLKNLGKLRILQNINMFLAMTADNNVFVTIMGESSQFVE